MIPETLRTDMITLYNKTLHFQLNLDRYDRDFSRLKQQEEALLQQIANACSESEAALKEIASYIPLYVEEMLSAISSKRKRNLRAVDNKMNMVSYFVPLLGEIPCAQAKALGQETVSVWNERMPEYKIGYTTYADIQGGFRKSPNCYITTAVCRSLNKPDSCYELELLRRYRDSYLMQEEEGAEIIAEYYNIAPTIVKRIGRRQDADTVYREIWETYLQPCIALIEGKKEQECKELYSTMVRRLEEKYVYLQEEKKWEI